MATATPHSNATSHPPLPPHLPNITAPSSRFPSKKHHPFTTKQARPTPRLTRLRARTMPTFAVPDDDSSVIDGENSAMDIDGDSFQEQQDGITRTRDDPQMQMHHQHTQNTQQPYQSAPQHDGTPFLMPFARRAQPEPQQQQPHFPSTRSMGVRYSISPQHDQHMLHADVPSSIGKRKRDESQPPARDTYQPPPPEPEQPALRRIPAFIVTNMYTMTVSLLTGAWYYVRRLVSIAPERNAQDIEGAQNAQGAPNTPDAHTVQARQNVQSQQVLAVETDLSGRKRRAVPSGSFTPPSESPRSQGSNSSPAAKEAAESHCQAPGAFPNPALPSPEPSQSPVEEQTTQLPQPRASQPKSWRATSSSSSSQPKSFRDSDTMPNLDEYTRTGLHSIEPTLAEFRERSKGKPYADPADWDEIREEKRQQRQLREREEYDRWAARQDEKKKDEEEQFWAKEFESEDTSRLDAKHAAAAVKFGNDWRNDHPEFRHQIHHAFHTQGECESREGFYEHHEFQGLEAHNKAKVIEAEVARDIEEYNQNKLSPAQERAFGKTSAYKRFTISKKNDDHTTKALQEKQQPGSVAPAKKSGKGKRAAAKTKKQSDAQKTADASNEETSRPTTSSSHKPASYKGGMEPSPKQNAPGENMNKPWSYDKTMLPGKSVLKRQSESEAKDKKIEGLLERANRCKVESPQDQRFKAFMTERRGRERSYWQGFADDYEWKKAKARAEKEEERKLAEKAVEEARQKWEHFRLEKEQQRQAEEEATAKALEEELRAQEEERARQEAEEAARVKAAAEAEEARVKAEAEAEEARKAKEAQDAADHARKQILIRPLDPEWAERVQKAMDLRDRDTVVATAIDGTDLRRHDFGSLLPQEGTSDDSSGWLNDEIVNAFVATVVARKQEQVGYRKAANAVPPFEMYNSGWYTTYSKQGVKGLQRWSRRKGIQGGKLLKADILFFPINTGGHWQLLLIFPQQRKIEFLCSLGRKGAGALKAAREWLEMELGELYNAAEWTETTGRSGRQGNTDDCGVFVSMNALAAGKAYPFSDVSAEKMKDARRMVAAVLLNGGLRGDWDL